MIFGFHSRAFLTDELLETMGEIYCQGRRKAETQAVCLELGPLCSILEFSLPTQPLLRPAGVIRGAYTGAVQAYLTFSLALEVERPTSKAREKRPGDEVDIFYQTAHFFWLEMCRKPIFCSNVAQKCKTRSRLPEPQKNLL